MENKLIIQLIKKIDDLEVLVTKRQKVTMSIAEYAKHSGVGDNVLREWCASVNLNFPCFKIGVKTLICVESADQFIKKLSENHTVL